MSGRRPSYEVGPNTEGMAPNGIKPDDRGPAKPVRGRAVRHVCPGCGASSLSGNQPGFRLRGEARRKEMTTVEEPVAHAKDTVAVCTMFRHCAARAAVVSRPALWEGLEGAGRVTVVSAPAGSGKTVLLRSWIGEAGLA